MPFDVSTFTELSPNHGMGSGLGETLLSKPLGNHSEIKDPLVSPHQTVLALALSWAKVRRCAARFPSVLHVFLQSQGFLAGPWSSVGLAGSPTEGEQAHSPASQWLRLSLIEHPACLSDTERGSRLSLSMLQPGLEPLGGRELVYVVKQTTTLCLCSLGLGPSADSAATWAPPGL